MPIVVHELDKSRKVNIGFDKQSAILEYFCRGTSDDVQARAAIIAVTPALFFGLQFQDLDITPLGGDCWTGSANYSSAGISPLASGQGGVSPPPAPPAAPAGTSPLGPGISFDISTVSETVTQSLATVDAARVGGRNTPFTGQAIGITRDGEVKGCEKLSPKFEWSITKTMGYVTLNYFATLSRLVGKTNQATFYGFAAGELLSIGASGTIKDTSVVEVTLKYGASPNQTNIVLASTSFSGTAGYNGVSIPTHFYTDLSGYIPDFNDDLGRRIEIISGTGWTPGFYTIMEVESNFFVLDNPPAAAGSTGAVWTFADGLIVPAKKGWEYLWVGYKDSSSEGIITQIPDFYKLEKIYEAGDFTLFGIGS